MEVSVRYLKQLIDALSKKHRKGTDMKGLEAICEAVNVTPSYLYKKIANPIANLRDNDKIRLRTSIVSQLLNDIGFATISEFEQHVDSPMSQQARSLIGSYYSYVRRNTTDGVLLRSPVQIKEVDHQLIFMLTGDRLEYKGKLELSNGVVSVLMNSMEGKAFHHIYRIGTMEKPKVIQGIFSGVTSGFDPIGGRVVLERREEAFSGLKPAALDIAELKKTRLKSNQQLATYFSKYVDNNLKVGRSASFSFNDLA
jgi:hypothetical protein